MSWEWSGTIEPLSSRTMWPSPHDGGGRHYEHDGRRDRDHAARRLGGGGAGPSGEYRHHPRDRHHGDKHRFKKKKRSRWDDKYRDERGPDRHGWEGGDEFKRPRPGHAGGSPSPAGKNDHERRRVTEAHFSHVDPWGNEVGAATESPAHLKPEDLRKFCEATDLGMECLDTAAEAANKDVWYDGLMNQSFRAIVNDEHRCTLDGGEPVGDDFVDAPDVATTAGLPSCLDCLRDKVPRGRDLADYLVGYLTEYPHYMNAAELGAGGSGDLGSNAKDPRKRHGIQVAFPRYVVIPKFHDLSDVKEEESAAPQLPGLKTDGADEAAKLATSVEELGDEGFDFEQGEWYYDGPEENGLGRVGPNSMFTLREKAFLGEIPWGLSLMTKNHNYTILQPDHHENDRRRLSEQGNFTRWVRAKLEEDKERLRLMGKLTGDENLRPRQVHSFVRSKVHTDALGKFCESHLDTLLSAVADTLPEEYHEVGGFLEGKPEGTKAQTNLPRREANQVARKVALIPEVMRIRLRWETEPPKPPRSPIHEAPAPVKREKATAPAKREKAPAPAKKEKQAAKKKAVGDKSRMAEDKVAARKAECKKTGFGCGRCRWSPAGYLGCNEAKKIAAQKKKLAKLEAEKAAQKLEESGFV